MARRERLAYVRFHGRNASTWNKRTGSAAERFDPLYSEDELEEWVPTLRGLAGGAENAYAMFNNNGRSPAPPGFERGFVEGEEVAQAPTHALMLKQLLAAA